MRTFSVVVALVGATVLAGCGGTTDTAPPPAPSTSAVASPSPSPTAPALPDAARANTKAGAVAFVRHYIDLINHAQATGDTKALAAVEDRRCKSCSQVRSFLQALYADGGHFEGGSTRVVRVVDVVSPAQFGDYAIDVVVSIRPSTVVRLGAKPDRTHGGRNTLGFYPDWTGSAWKVAQWTRAK